MIASSRTPIWTAFVTNSLLSSLWLRRSGSTIYLSGMRRHVFTSEYTPMQTMRGEQILEFTTTHGKCALWIQYPCVVVVVVDGGPDAKGFERTIHDLADVYRRL